MHDQLHGGKQPGQRQVEHLQRLDIDLHFQRGKARPAQQEDHPKAGEIEQEYQQRRRQDRRAQQRQGHFPEGRASGEAPRLRAACSRRGSSPSQAPPTTRRTMVVL